LFEKQIIKYKPKMIILEVTVNLALFLVLTNQILAAKLIYDIKNAKLIDI